MEIIYQNAFYNPDSRTGRNVHVYQFIRHAKKLGHKIWTYEPDSHPDAERLPVRRIQRLFRLRQADVFYVRLESEPPPALHWGVPPRRSLLGKKTPIVWEFNTVPEFGQVIGHSALNTQRSINGFRRYSSGCDLAICVSNALSDYVGENLGIKNVVVIPNGSDPGIFRPDVKPVDCIEKNLDKLHVVWIGSAGLAWHDFDLIRDAARILWHQAGDRCIDFHIIGRRFKEMRNMPPNVHYYGAEEYEKLPHWLAAMDVGLVLYRQGPGYFSSPLKLFDYLSAGLVVVGTEQPQLREIFGELDTVDMIVDTVPEALACKLLALSKNRENLPKIGEAGRRLVVKKYNWQNTVSLAIDAIEKVRNNIHV